MHRKANSILRPEIFSGGYGRTNHHRRVKKHEMLPQNVDLPPVLPKKKKKPFPIPLKKIVEAAREDKKLAQMGIEKHLEPPKNGILVPDLVPVAYDVLDAWKVLISGLAQLLHVVPVHACRYCIEPECTKISHNIYIALGVTFLCFFMQRVFRNSCCPDWSQDSRLSWLN